MELMQEVKGNYSDRREEEEEEEGAEIMRITREGERSRLHQQDAAASNFRKQLELMELSLGSNKEEEEEGNLREGQGQGQGHGHGHHHHHDGNCSSSSTKEIVEKEHMFDKVVTPSDVGKLNRLVIPKQHAEKYFPLDSSSNEKGLLLNFEDRNGKVWRFRYSYWNSSQSYVMTKGWSRFVKEKKLDAGDIVSFQRGMGDVYRHRLYIDWRRRPDHPPDTSPSPLFLPSVRWAGRFYSLPPTVPPRYNDHFHHFNYNNIFTFQQQQHHHYFGTNNTHHNHYAHLNSGSGSSSLYYSVSMAGDHQHFPDRGTNMIIDSVPVAHHHHHAQGGIIGAASSSSAASGSNNSAAPAGGKRLRLFGVNMECASSAEDSKGFSSSSAAHVAVSNSLPSSSLQRLTDEDPLSLSPRFGFGDPTGGTSMIFDLDPSLQYRH
ncbi:hypothetical protein VNO77_18769 [Canavalia gladiata]|uniref:TF-B3 domain-containing protein n=1 Tax=Canavalia gladiata TaxID=3824 RepID=A0AAN9LRE0_CANGL